jgi:hypothetical protein
LKKKGEEAMTGKILISILIAVMVTAFNPVITKAEPSPEIKEMMVDFVSVFDFYLYRVELALTESFSRTGSESFKSLNLVYDYQSNKVKVTVVVNDLNKYLIDWGKLSEGKSSREKGLHQIFDWANAVLLRYSNTFHYGYAIEEKDYAKSLNEIINRTEISIVEIEIDLQNYDEKTKTFKMKNKEIYRTSLNKEKWVHKKYVESEDQGNK